MKASTRAKLLTAAGGLALVTVAAWSTGHYGPSVGCAVLTVLVAWLGTMYGRDKTIPLGTKRVASLADEAAARSTLETAPPPMPGRDLPHTPQTEAWRSALRSGLAARGTGIDDAGVDDVAAVVAAIGAPPIGVTV